MNGKEGYIIISDDRQNSYGCKVKTEGIDYSDFLKNPVLLLNHNPNILLGRIEDLHVEDGKLIGKPVFDKDDNDEAAKWAGKWERGFLKAASPHLDINETEFVGDMLFVSKSELCEVSLTPTPGNKNALKLTKGGSQISNEEIKLMYGTNNTNKNTMSKIQLMAKSLGLALTATEDEVLSTVEKLTEAHKAQAKELSEIKLSIANKEKEAAEAFERNCIKLIDDAAKAGKIGMDAATKETYTRFAKADFDGTKKMLDEISPRMALSARVNNTPEGGSAAGEDRTAWGYKDWEKKDRQGLQLMKKENPEQYSALLQKLNADLKAKGAI